MFCLFPAYSREHHRALVKDYQASLAKGTWGNKKAHLVKLLQFCERHELQPDELTEYDILSFILFLKNDLSAPSSVFNYLSGARTWFLSCTGSARPFDTYKVSVLKKGISRTMHHEVNRVEPLLPAQLKHACRALSELGEKALPIISLLTIAFFSALRQSNLVLRNAEDRPVHTLLRRDVKLLPHALNLIVRTSKTVRCPKDYKVFSLPEIPGSICCPRSAWKEYSKKVKHGTSCLAFVMSDGTPLTSRVATPIVRLALVGSSYKDPCKFTFHGCRRGAAQSLALAGSSIEQIKSLGQWSSNSVFTYVPRSKLVTEPETLKVLFG